MTDRLANGDQQMLLETLKQIEIINSPLPLEAVVKKEKNVHKDYKYDYAEEQEQRKARHTQTHETDSEIERMRLEFELTILKRQHEENDRQRLHEEKMEHIRQGSPSRSGAHVEEEQFVGKLDPITEIELEKLRMEFELAKLKHISEENEKQRQHEQKLYEEKEKQRQHEEKMEQMRQRQGNLHIVSQKVSGCSPAEATTETASVAFTEMGKMRIELQLALEVYRPEMKEKKLSGEQNGHQETPKCEQQLETTSEVKKANMPPEQRNDGVTEHLGLQVPRIVVNGAESQWSSSRLDLAIETELEKRRMEFELTRLRYEHEENERQRQHEQKMEQLRQQRQHEEKMEEMRLQAPSGQVSGGGHHFLLPHDPLTLFLYCFIFIHLIYIAKELIFFFFKKHGMFAIGAVLIFAIKIFWN
ncbi:transmembrane protein 247 [Notechis scutatus]|uniref:Transmembrane protein 247 n=1 Tax=Notechis scutatus TaxID=8663 RepID=A0A6J1V7U5_9SAUR|nr:transmembrane protein 247 [Notechis scutatus]